MISYRLGPRLVEGGAAEIYSGKAVDEQGGERAVALKAVRPDQSGRQDARLRFAEEALLLSRLKHPNVIELLDFVEIEGRDFQVLEYVDGTDLRSWSKGFGGQRPGFELPTVIHVVQRVAAALEYVHAARDDEGQVFGIVHRDVSPGNIMLTQTAVVKLIDFGIARWKSSEMLTRIGETVGTPGFMSPEQLAGGPVDSRADQFALACVAHWMLCGRSPLDTEHALDRVMLGEPVAIDPRIPVTCRPSLGRALDPKPLRRFDSTEAFAEAFVEAVGLDSTSPAVSRHEDPPPSLWNVPWDASERSLGELERQSRRPPTIRAAAPEATAVTVAKDRDGGTLPEVRTDLTFEASVATAPATLLEGPDLESSTLREYVSTPPESVAPRRARAQRRVTATAVLLVVVASSALVAFAVTFLSDRRRPPAPVSPPVPRAIVTERADAPELIAVAPIAPTSTETISEDDPDAVDRVRPKSNRKRPRHSNKVRVRGESKPAPEDVWNPPIVVWSVDRALEEHSLPAGGLDWIAPSDAVRWRQCLERKDTPCLDRLGPSLIEAINKTSVDADFLSAQLARVEKLLRERAQTLSERDLESFDRRLLDLKLVAKQNPHRRQLRIALQEVRRMQSQLRSGRR